MCAADVGTSRLEVLDVVLKGVPTGERGAEVACDIEVTGVFEEEYIEFAVVDLCVFEEMKGPAVVAAVAYQDKGPFTVAAVAFDPDLLRGAASDLGDGEHIAEGAQLVFTFPGRMGDDLCIEADAGELYEIGVVGLAEVDWAGVPCEDDLPSCLELGGNPEFGCEYVHGADGQDSESDA